MSGHRGQDHLPISVGGAEAVAIALALGDEPPRRPVTHDLMAAFVEALDAHVERVELTELRDGVFLAELAVSGPTGHRRIDSRPSDAIALAVRVDAPLFVSAAVLDETGVLLTAAPDDAIEEEVARFRAALEALDGVEFPPDERDKPSAATSEHDAPGDLPLGETGEGHREPESDFGDPPDPPRA